MFEMAEAFPARDVTEQTVPSQLYRDDPSGGTIWSVEVVVTLIRAPHAKPRGRLVHLVGEGSRRGLVQPMRHTRGVAAARVEGAVPVGGEGPVRPVQVLVQPPHRIQLHRAHAA